jgi:hypothetical protein
MPRPPMSDSPVARGGLIDATARVFATLGQRTGVAFLVGFLALGAMMSVAIPAFQVPDENAHWWVGLRRANAFFGGNRRGVCGAAVELPRYLGYDRIRWRGIDERMHPRLGLGLEGITPTCTEHYIPYGVATSYPSVLLGYPYFFAAAKKSGTSAAYYFLFARVVAGLLLAFSFWRVIKAFEARGPTPGLATMAAFLWSPLFVQQGFAVTSDTTIVCFAFAIIAVCLRTPSVPKLDLALFTVMGITATWTKPTIVPVALVPALWVLASHLPGAPWRLANLRALWTRLGRNRQSVVIVGVSLLLVASAFVAFASMGGSDGIGTLEGGRAPSKQMAHVERNLSVTLKLFIANIRSNIVLSALNGVLGWLDTSLPFDQYFLWRRLVYAAFGFDVVFVLLVVLQAGPRGWLRRIVAWVSTGAGILLGVGASMVAVTLALYVATTDVAAGMIEGVQPRYFFPSILVSVLALSAIRLAPSTWPVPRLPAPRWLPPVASVVTWGVLLYLGFAFVRTFAYVYVALWQRFW